MLEDGELREQRGGYNTNFGGWGGKRGRNEGVMLRSRISLHVLRNIHLKIAYRASPRFLGQPRIETAFLKQED